MSNTQNSRIPDGFMPFPNIFLQAEAPLKLSIYVRSSRGVGTVVLFKARGAQLAMDEMIKLQKMGRTNVLAKRAEATEQALALFDEQDEL